MAHHEFWRQGRPATGGFKQNSTSATVTHAVTWSTSLPLIVQAPWIGGTATYLYGESPDERGSGEGRLSCGAREQTL